MVEIHAMSSALRHLCYDLDVVASCSKLQIVQKNIVADLDRLICKIKRGRNHEEEIGDEVETDMFPIECDALSTKNNA